jgi:membrane-associated phospholipid phosphatase
MLGLILVEFFLRQICDNWKLKATGITVSGVAGTLLVGLVGLSRILLGMHSINEVLFGFALGLYSVILYYTYLQRLLIRLGITLCSRLYRNHILITTAFLILVHFSVAGLITFVPKYPHNNEYFTVIEK